MCAPVHLLYQCWWWLNWRDGKLVKRVGCLLYIQQNTPLLLNVLAQMFAHLHPSTDSAPEGDQLSRMVKNPRWMIVSVCPRTKKCLKILPVIWGLR